MFLISLCVAGHHFLTRQKLINVELHWKMHFKFYKLTTFFRHFIHNLLTEAFWFALIIVHFNEHAHQSHKSNHIHTHTRFEIVFVSCY